MMLHGFPILLHGTSNTALIRSILDLEHWFIAVHGGRDIAHVRRHFIKLALGRDITHFSAGVGDSSPGASSSSKDAGSPGASALHCMRLMMPVPGKGYTKQCFESSGYISVPKKRNVSLK
jgi:hypothetical protein